jgi:intracellular septation protein A
MNQRTTAPVVSGMVAAIAAFIVWILLDNGIAGAVGFAVVAGVIAAAITWVQYRNRT